MDKVRSVLRSLSPFRGKKSLIDRSIQAITEAIKATQIVLEKIISGKDPEEEITKARVKILKASTIIRELLEEGKYKNLVPYLNKIVIYLLRANENFGKDKVNIMEMKIAESLELLDKVINLLDKEKVPVSEPPPRAPLMKSRYRKPSKEEILSIARKTVESSQKSCIVNNTEGDRRRIVNGMLGTYEDIDPSIKTLAADTACRGVYELVEKYNGRIPQEVLDDLILEIAGIIEKRLENVPSTIKEKQENIDEAISLIKKQYDLGKTKEEAKRLVVNAMKGVYPDLADTEIEVLYNRMENILTRPSTEEASEDVTEFIQEEPSVSKRIFFKPPSPDITGDLRFINRTPKEVMKTGPEEEKERLKKKRDLSIHRNIGSNYITDIYGKHLPTFPTKVNSSLLPYISTVNAMLDLVQAADGSPILTSSSLDVILDVESIAMLVNTMTQPMRLLGDDLELAFMATNFGYFVEPSGKKSLKKVMELVDNLTGSQILFKTNWIKTLISKDLKNKEEYATKIVRSTIEVLYEYGKECHTGDKELFILLESLFKSGESHYDYFNRIVINLRKNNPKSILIEPLEGLSSALNKVTGITKPISEGISTVFNVLHSIIEDITYNKPEYADVNEEWYNQLSRIIDETDFTGISLDSSQYRLFARRLLGVRTYPNFYNIFHYTLLEILVDFPLDNLTSLILGLLGESTPTVLSPIIIASALKELRTTIMKSTELSTQTSFEAIKDILSLANRSQSNRQKIDYRKISNIILGFIVAEKVSSL